MKRLSFICFLVLFSVLSCKTTEKKVWQIDISLSARDQLEIGRKLHFKGEFKDAIEQYGAIIEYYGKNVSECAWAQYELALCYYEKKKFGMALDEFRRVIKKYSDIPGPVILAEKMILKIESKIRSKGK